MKLGSPVYPLTNVDIPVVEGMYAKESRDAVVRRCHLHVGDRESLSIRSRQSNICTYRRVRAYAYIS